MKILVRATNWIGDAVMSLPALQAIRRRFADAEIAVVARPSVADIYRHQPICDQLIAYDSHGTHAGFSGREKLARELREQGFDLAILLQNAFDAAWLTWRAAIPQRVGYARDGRSLLLTKAVPVPKTGEIPPHEKFYYLELLRRAGWLDQLSDEPFIELAVSEERRADAAKTLLNAGARQNAIRIAIAAGASYGSAKCWLPVRFADVATRLQSEFDADIILFGTASEVSVTAAIASYMHRSPIDLAGRTKVVDLPALFSQCHLFIGNDSGAMHVAAAVGLPGVAIFGPTDAQGTAPVTQRCSIVQKKTHCNPCFLRRCPIDHRCMNRITASDVESALKPWLRSLEVHPV